MPQMRSKSLSLLKAMPGFSAKKSIDGGGGVKVAAANFLGGGLKLFQGREDLLGEQACEIAAERRDDDGHGREEDVGEDFPYIVQRIFFLWCTRVERDEAARDDDGARFLGAIEECKTALIPAQEGARAAGENLDVLQKFLRVGAGRGVDDLAVLGDEAIDPPSLKCAAVRLHLADLLAAICLRLEGADGELYGQSLALVLPQERKLRFADRARRLEPREEQAAEYEQEADGKRDHQEVGQEDALFEGNVSEFEHGDLLFSLPQQGQAASQGA